MFISKKNNISSVKKLPLIKSIINDQMNNECFDCGSPNPKYISINNAIFLCGNCSKLHKTFPLEISRIINNNLYTIFFIYILKLDLIEIENCQNLFILILI